MSKGFASLLIKYCIAENVICCPTQLQIVMSAMDAQLAEVALSKYRFKIYCKSANLDILHQKNNSYA